MRLLHALLALPLAACAAPTAGPPDRALLDTTPIAASGARLTVLGLSCPNCSANIDLQIQEVQGVAGVQVDLGTGFVDVAFDGTEPKPSAAELATAVTDAGFTVIAVDPR